jgi:hypothetical protein
MRGFPMTAATAQCLCLIRRFRVLCESLLPTFARKARP